MLKSSYKKNDEIILAKHVKKEKDDQNFVMLRDLYESFSSPDWLREGGQGRLTTRYLLAKRLSSRT